MKPMTIAPESLETAKRNSQPALPAESLTRHIVFQSLEKSLRNFPMFGKIIVIAPAAQSAITRTEHAKVF